MSDRTKLNASNMASGIHLTLEASKKAKEAEAYKWGKGGPGDRLPSLDEARESLEDLAKHAMVVQMAMPIMEAMMDVTRGNLKEAGFSADMAPGLFLDDDHGWETTKKAFRAAAKLAEFSGEITGIYSQVVEDNLPAMLREEATESDIESEPDPDNVA